MEKTNLLQKFKKCFSKDSCDSSEHGINFSILIAVLAIICVGLFLFFLFE